MELQNILKNEWFVNIVGGIITTIIISTIAYARNRNKQNKEYIQKIVAANNEILYNIKPLIIEQKQIKLEVLSSLFNATARKYGVDVNKMYSNKELSEELVKEIISNPFLSADDKNKFSDLCLKIKSLCTIEQERDYSKPYVQEEIYMFGKKDYYLDILLIFSTFVLFCGMILMAANLNDSFDLEVISLRKLKTVLNNALSLVSGLIIGFYIWYLFRKYLDKNEK